MPDDRVPWLTAEETATWLYTAGVLMALPAAIDAQLKRDAGVNFFEYSILVTLARERDRTAQMTTLATLTGGSLSRLSHAVGRLEKQGWVQRTGKTRCIEATLTDAGLDHLTAAAPGHVREVRRIFIDTMTPRQVGQLQTIFRQVLTVASPATAALLREHLDEAEG
ncbi:MarR family winged helix-turn-helix transcriptional regulator [Actinoplanes sp. NPDC004185]